MVVAQRLSQQLLPQVGTHAKLAQVFGVGIEALRNEDLTRQPDAASPKPGGSPQPGNHRREEAPTRPAKYPLLVSVELDGTAASLERAVARLVAINEVVAETD